MGKDFNDQVDKLAESLMKRNPSLTMKKAKRLAINELTAAADQLGGGFEPGSRGKDAEIKIFSFFKKNKR